MQFEAFCLLATNFGILLKVLSHTASRIQDSKNNEIKAKQAPFVRITNARTIVSNLILLHGNLFHFALMMKFFFTIFKIF